jgi:hypothetical protein
MCPPVIDAECEPMHDLDRTQLEQPFELGAAGETALGEILGEMGQGVGEAETQELELASRLLDVQSEQELEQFLGDLVAGAVKGARALAATPTGQKLTGILKDAAKQALPVVGGAIGSYVSPSSDQAWGERAGRTAADLLGLELEGLSHEDREFEVARRVVQFGREGYRNLAQADAAGHLPPASAHAATALGGVPAGDAGRGISPAQLRQQEWAIARDAATQAARRFMPGIVPQLAAGTRPGAQSVVTPHAVTADLAATGSPSAAFAVAPRAAGPAATFAPTLATGSPSASFAAAPGAIGAAAGAPHHLPLEGRWVRRGRALIVLLA